MPLVRRDSASEGIFAPVVSLSMGIKSLWQMAAYRAERKCLQGRFPAPIWDIAENICASRVLFTVTHLGRTASAHGFAQHYE